MHYSDVQFWRHLQLLEKGHEDLPSPRVCRLLLRMFEKWKGRPGWLTEGQVGHLFRDRADVRDDDRRALAALPIPVRKALAIKRMLELIVEPNIARLASTFEVSADELIVGTLPPFSVGQGKEFVRYLTTEEELQFALQYLNELSPMGHVVPDHGVVLRRGLEAVAKEMEDRAGDASTPTAQSTFFRSVAISVRAVIGFARAYAVEARRIAGRLPDGDPNKSSLNSVADCLEVAPRFPAKSFHQALQAIHIVHCALHWTVEIVPIGRLDQLLDPYYQRDVDKKILTRDLAQELIECFWIKLDERAILDFRHAENRFTACDGVLTGYYGSSNYDQGGLLNQWMQQITIGGVAPDDKAEATDACNEVTRLCLDAARRLPLNSPTLDLRVHAKTPDDVINLAARALMSGGAHPVILNDDVIVNALANQCGAPIPLADARNYACDGCYETMVAGASEFSFGFVSALDVIEKTLNRGAGLGASGPIHLRGMKDSWRSKRAADIESFSEFQSILRSHMLLCCHRYLRSLTAFYGNKAAVAPSPLLSALIQGCLEDGIDFAAGGARYHIFSPLLVGVSSAADSLHVIQALVFKKPAFTLTELTTCLATDWGHRLLSVTGESTVAFGVHVDLERIRAIRELCLAQPKFGNGRAEVDQHAWWLLETFADCVRTARNDAVHAESFAQLDRNFGRPGRPFALHLAPGVGTFEQYVFSGTFNGASADGRRAGAPIASDLSPAPIANDRPATEASANGLAHARVHDLRASLRSYAHPVAQRFGDGMPVDYNISEHMPVTRLAEMIRAFAGSHGGSICTFTVANPETFANAQRDPAAHNLLRVRMGGWTEFFVALFPDHQEQHRRRPLYA